jgi:hypothetical protein
MNINSLIAKYGEPATLNGVSIYAFVDEDKLLGYLGHIGFKEYTGLKMASVLIKEAINFNDVFVMNGIEYLVFESKEIRKSGIRIYSDVVFFENDFVNDVKIYTQSLNLKGCNLPSMADIPYKEVKARVKTVKPSDYLQYAMHGEKTPTHVISILFEDGVGVTDMIEWGSRSFEVLNSENVDEQDRILIVNTVEVLSG